MEKFTLHLTFGDESSFVLTSLDDTPHVSSTLEPLNNEQLLDVVKQCNLISTFCMKMLSDRLKDDVSRLKLF